MPNIMLIMHRKAIAQGLMDRLKNSSDIHLIYEPNYDNANFAIGSYNAKVALIEVAESGAYDMAYCLTLCKRLRQHTPECKLILMCPEHDEGDIKHVIDYLASKLISI